MTEKRLYRSRGERMLGGVCGGLAEYFGLDVTLVRLVTVVLVLLTSGSGLLAYILLWVLVPEEPVEGSPAMSDTTSVPVPEPTPEPQAPEPGVEPAAAAPTYSAPTYTPPAQPPAAPAAPAAPQAPPQYAAPQPVTGSPGGREARNSGIMGGVILIVLGGIFLVSQFVPGVDIGKLWPLILIAIGVGIILRRR